jgi:type VI protein secretion system component Hcp
MKSAQKDTMNAKPTPTSRGSRGSQASGQALSDEQLAEVAGGAKQLPAPSPKVQMQDIHITKTTDKASP